MTRFVSLALPLTAAIALTGCTVGARSGRSMAVGYQAYRGDPANPEPVAVKPDPDRIPGTPSIRVLWEALAVEKYRSDTSVFKRVDAGGDPRLGRIIGKPEWEVILLNTSFSPTAEQDKDNKSCPPSGRIARATDQNMIDLMTAFQRMGFFKYAKSTGSMESMFESENARGRITVERNGESVTLLSQRGLGLQEETKEIPRIYAEAKEAVYRLKNMSPGLRIKGTSVEPTDPRNAKPAPAPGSGTGGNGK